MDKEKRFVIETKEIQRADTHYIIDVKTGGTLFSYTCGRREELQILVDVLNFLNDLVLDSLTPLD